MDIPRTYPAAAPVEPSLADQLRALMAKGLTAGEARNIFAEATIEAFAGVIAAAREEHACDEVEIDDMPEVSEGDGGCWVAAWVWVETADEDSEETCDECGAHLDGDHELGCSRWDTF